MKFSKPEHGEDKEVAEEVRMCRICMLGEAMQKLTTEGIDHMEGDMGLANYGKASPQDPPLMEVQVKVLSQEQNQFLGRGPSCRQC